jgi:hypothetical protein
MKKEDIAKKIDSIFEEAEIDSQTMDLGDAVKLLANESDLPFADLQIHDYESDIEEVSKEAKDTLDSMAELYLGSNPEILNHSYIMRKKMHDAANHADMLFLQKMAKRALLMQLKQMDLGDTTPRHYETFYSGLKEVRENIKQSTSTQSLMEGFYRSIREDLGIETKPSVSETSEGAENGTEAVTNQRDLNAKLEEMARAMAANRDKKQ